MDEIDQDVQVSSASQFKKQVWKAYVSVENMLPSKIKRRKWYDDYVKYVFFFIPEVKNRTVSRLLNACFAIINRATSFWLIQNCEDIYRTNTAFSRAVLAISQTTAGIFTQTIKFPPLISCKWLC